jgi:hypothetical protein
MRSVLSETSRGLHQTPRFSQNKLCTLVKTMLLFQGFDIIDVESVFLAASKSIIVTENNKMKAKKYFYQSLGLTAVLLTSLLTGCGEGDGVAAPGDSDEAAAPTATFSTSSTGDSGLQVNTDIEVIFDESLDVSTINLDNFTVTSGTGDTLVSVGGTLSYVDNLVSFDPSASLAPNTEYTATLTTDINDSAGNSLVSPSVWNFTTGAITSVETADGAELVAKNHKVVVSFIEDIVEAGLTFTVVGANESEVVGDTTYDAASNSVSFVPTSGAFSGSTLYTATIKTVVDGVVTNYYVWSFTTSDESDLAPPVALVPSPANEGTGVPINGNVTALFNESLDPATVNDLSFTLTSGTVNALVSVAGSVSYAQKLVSFNPTQDLVPETEYTATLTTYVKDLAGNSLTIDYTWTFMTGSNLAAGPDPVNLRTTGDFVILTKTGISTTGDTSITGDIGVSPAPRTYITGFSDTFDSSNTYSTSIYVIEDGKIYAADMTPPTPAKMTTAISDMETAYTAAAGVAPDYTELYAGDISGETLVPGTYKWGTNVWIYDDVTLNGSANDVWIFQISGDLILANGQQVLLTGGAVSKNVFWQVAGGAGVSLGTTSVFEGVALAHKAIIVKTGAAVNGRLLGQTAVTLDNNAVTQPAQ